MVTKKSKLNIKPVEIVDDSDKMSFIDEFGETALVQATNNLSPNAGPNVENNLQTIIEGAKEIIRERNSQALTRLDILKEQTDSLGNCVTIASHIYQNSPIPDHAYQLTALASAFNASLAQVDKMQDPLNVYNELNSLMATMFTEVIKKMVINIDRIRKDLSSKNPEVAKQIQENFERMLKDISPDTEASYEQMQHEIRKILGIRKSGKSQKSDKES